MITSKPEIMAIFNKACFSTTLVMFIGLITCLHLADRDLKGVAIELPFFLLNGLIIYLQHPLAK